MTFEAVLVTAILGAAVALFVTERLPVDVVALLVLISLVLTGLVDVEQALAGFGNPAVVTIGAVFVLSGGLSRTGIASLVGRQVLRLAGDGEITLLVVLMTAVAIMSGFMNDIGVAALMLPVVMDIARRTGRPPSKLLIPLSFGALMGGKMTLIGTAANILLSGALVDFGLEPFGLFDFAPVGLVAVVAGIAYMSLVGRHLLPAREVAGDAVADLPRQYGLGHRLHYIRLPARSRLDGHALAESRLGAALDLNVLAIVRDGQMMGAPGPDTVLRSEDRLLVEGELGLLDELVGRHHLVPSADAVSTEGLVGGDVILAEVTIASRSRLEGRTLLSIGFRHRFRAVVLALRRGDEITRTKLEHEVLEAGDVLLVQLRERHLAALQADARFRTAVAVTPGEAEERYRLSERLFALRVTERSALVDRSLAASRLGDAFAMAVVAHIRDGRTRLLLDPNDTLAAGDTLIVKARSSDLAIGRGLIALEVESGPAPELPDMEAQGIGLIEVVLAPRSRLAGLTPRQIRFRDRYGVSLLAISRGGQVLDVDRRDLEISFGDALLLFGPSKRLMGLGREPDFLALTEAIQEAPRLERAPVAAAVLVGVVGTVIAGWVPIAVAALTGAVLMILTGCLTTREAYRSVEWQAIMLVAGMLPLGIAMQDTGLAGLVAERVVDAVGALGPVGVMSGLFFLAALAAQIMPTAAVAVLMAPIGINAAVDLGMSPHALLMLIAMAVSSSFITPVGHPVNLLVMGPGSYRFSDYARVGLPLTIVVFVAVMLAMPLFWPLMTGSP